MLSKVRFRFVVCADDRLPKSKREFRPHQRKLDGIVLTVDNHPQLYMQPLSSCSYKVSNPVEITNITRRTESAILSASYG